MREERDSQEGRQRSAARERPELLLALIEHGSRPAAILLVGLLVVVWLFAVREPLFRVLRNATLLKLPWFEIQLQQRAAANDVVAELEKLQTLNDEQLQLFLVVGKKREHIAYEGEEVTQENLEALRAAGLLDSVESLGEKRFRWQVSRDGHRLHDIIRQLVFEAIRSSPR
jgi:hypothetical protein